MLYDENREDWPGYDSPTALYRYYDAGGAGVLYPLHRQEAKMATEARKRA
jgi:hypothetical protein